MNGVCLSNMGFIPGDVFFMGCHTNRGDTCDLHGAPTFGDEFAQVAVNVPDFLIDRYEVSVGDYTRCVAAGDCTPTTGAVHGSACADVTDDPRDNDHPAVNVTWHQAKNYCEAHGKRLCTESEWEMAACGTCGPSDNCAGSMGTYPWGNVAPTCDRANFDGSCANQCTRPVGHSAYSSYGMLDMAGNVAEYTADCWGATADTVPTDGTAFDDHPVTCELVVRKGGSYRADMGDSVRAAARTVANANEGDELTGFRCCASTD